MLSQSSQYLLIIVVHIHNNDVLKDFYLIGHSSKEVSVIYPNLFINTKKYNMIVPILFSTIFAKKNIYIVFNNILLVSQLLSLH